MPGVYRLTFKDFYVERSRWGHKSTFILHLWIASGRHAVPQTSRNQVDRRGKCHEMSKMLIQVSIFSIFFNVFQGFSHPFP